MSYLNLRFNWQQLLGSIAGTLALYGVYQILRLVYASWTNPLRDLPGPKNASWFYGNLKDIWQAVCLRPQALACVSDLVV